MTIFRLSSHLKHYLKKYWVDDNSMAAMLSLMNVTCPVRRSYLSVHVPVSFHWVHSACMLYLSLIEFEVCTVRYGEKRGPKFVRYLLISPRLIGRTGKETGWIQAANFKFSGSYSGKIDQSQWMYKLRDKIYHHIFCNWTKALQQHHREMAAVALGWKKRFEANWDCKALTKKKLNKIKAKQVNKVKTTS